MGSPGINDSPQSVKSQVFHDEYEGLAPRSNKQSFEARSSNEQAFSTQISYAPLAHLEPDLNNFGAETHSRGLSNTNKSKSNTSDDALLNLLQNERNALSKQNANNRSTALMIHAEHNPTTMVEHTKQRNGFTSDTVPPISGSREGVIADLDNPEGRQKPQLANINARNARSDPLLVESKSAQPTDQHEQIFESLEKEKSHDTVQNAKENVKAAKNPTSPSKDQPFQRWKNSLFAGRYIPRRAARIPQEQREILDSNHSWQPALVGHTTRVGDLPLEILNRLTPQYDPKSTETQQTEESRVPEENKEPQKTSSDLIEDTGALAVEGKSLTEEESATSIASWSPSPEKRKHLRQREPDSSPVQRTTERPKFFEETHELDDLESETSIDIEEENVKEVSATQQLQTELNQFDAPTDHPSSENLIPGSLPKATIVQDVTSATDDGNVSSSFQVNSKAATNDSERKIQVMRTPYLDDGSSSVQVSRLHQNQVKLQDHLTSSVIVNSFEDHVDDSPFPAAGPQTRLESGPEIDNRISNENIDDRSATLPNNVTASRSPLAKNVAEHKRHLGSATIPATPSPKKHTEILQAGTQYRSSVVLPEQKIADDVTNPEVEFSIQPVKRRADGEDGDYNFNKRRKRLSSKSESNGSADPEVGSILEELRQYRRAILPPQDKSKSSRHPSNAEHTFTAKKVSDWDEGGDLDKPIKPGNTISQGIEIVPNRLASRFSNHGDEAVSRTGQIRNTRGNDIEEAEVCDCNETTFYAFQRAYPEYRGKLDNFIKACQLLIKMRNSNSPLHPFLYDDAVFHHYHSYRQYLLALVESGEDALPFGVFYVTHITTPNHLGGVIKASFLDHLSNPSLCGRDSRVFKVNASASTRTINVSPEIQRLEVQTNSSFDLSPSLQVARHSIEPEQHIPDQTDDLPPVDSPFLQGSDDMWTGKASGAASPELGTTEPEERLEDTLMIDLTSADPDRMTTKQISQPAVALSPMSKSRPRADSQIKPVTKSATSILTNKARKAKRLSASVFVSPGRSQRVEQPWWKDENTPFKTFAAHFNALPSESPTLSALTRQSFSPSGIHSALDIFSWRKR